ncbi:hypothetical protein [Streptomyces roseoverticillatus]|uniref:Uncharacterized protein n=1 Tax=Streptomyces roseoverticillatus TaxID=66429 RepID=A0ABV3IXM2_9ACTN
MPSAEAGASGGNEQGLQVRPTFSSASLCEVVSSYLEALAEQAALIEPQCGRLIQRIAQRRNSGKGIPGDLSMLAKPFRD